MRMPNIVLIEDDANQRHALQTWLELDGFNVWSAGSVESFYKLAAVQQFDLVVVDIGLPGESGLELIEYLRNHLQLIIIVLTARTSINDRLKAAELKVEHYLIKPVMPEDLSAIIRAEWQRKNNERASAANLPWYLDVAQQLLETPDHEKISLTSSEVLILQFLAQQVGPVSKNDIVVQLGAKPAQYDMHRLDVHLSRLRSKIRKVTNHTLFMIALPGQRLQLVSKIDLR